MRENAFINRQSRIAAQLEGILRIEDSHDLNLLADALANLATVKPAIEQPIWGAVVTVAQGCVHTIAQRYAGDLSIWQKCDLWQTLVWTIWYAHKYAPGRLARCTAGLLKYFEQNLDNQEFVTKSRAGLDLIVPSLGYADLQQLDRLLAQTQLARSQTRNHIAKQLRTTSQPSQPASSATSPSSADANAADTTTEKLGKPTVDATTIQSASQNSADVTPATRQAQHNPALRWLGSKLVLVGPCSTVQFDPALNDLAMFLGEHYSALALLHKAIKHSLSNNRNLAQVNQIVHQKERRVLRAFCKKLQSHGLITAHEYDPQKKTYSVDLRVSGDLEPFVTGLWFERFMYRKVMQTLSNHRVSRSHIENYNVRLANGENTEIDFFILIDNRPFLVEYKSGGEAKDVRKRRERTKKFRSTVRCLELPPDQAFFVAMSLTPRNAARWSTACRATALDSQIFLVHLEGLLRKTSPQPIKMMQ